jgi:hypothetical protein
MDPEEDGDENDDMPPAEAVKAASGGLKSYQSFFTALGAEQRKALLPFHERLKAHAAKADANEGR